MKQKLLKLETSMRELQITKFNKGDKARTSLSPAGRLLIFNLFYGGCCTRRS